MFPCIFNCLQRQLVYFTFYVINGKMTDSTLTTESNTESEKVPTQLPTQPIKMFLDSVNPHSAHTMPDSLFDAFVLTT